MDKFSSLSQKLPQKGITKEMIIDLIRKYSYEREADGKYKGYKSPFNKNITEKQISYLNHLTLKILIKTFLEPVEDGKYYILNDWDIDRFDDHLLSFLVERSLFVKLVRARSEEKEEYYRKKIDENCKIRVNGCNGLYTFLENLIIL